MKTSYTRSELIAICEMAFVPQKYWEDRDSFSAQTKLGKLYALLKAGCKFKIMTKKENPDGNCVTDEDTIWLKVWAKNFSWFEYGDEDSDKDGFELDGHFYLPTEKRLAEADGKDWY